MAGAPGTRRHRRAEAVRLLEAACAGYATIGAAGMLALAARDLDRVTGAMAAPGAGGVVGGPPATEPPPRPVRALLAPVPGEPMLTGAEVRVAVAVADGLSNRETADRLYVSVKTIEFHLGNIFRKLGLRNRTELARRLGS